MRRMPRVPVAPPAPSTAHVPVEEGLTETVSNVPRFRSEEEPERHRRQEKMDIVARFVLERLEKGDPDADVSRRR